MPSGNLKYRKNKLIYRFIPQITFNKLKEELADIIEEEEIKEDLLIVDTDDDLETTEEVEVEEIDSSTLTLNDLKMELLKIRKNAKRKLEVWIKSNRMRINIELNGLDKTELMNHIELKYFNK